MMNLLRKLGLGGKSKDAGIRRCMECGGELPEHMGWCPTLHESGPPGDKKTGEAKKPHASA